MKKILVILGCVMFIFSACGKDDDSAKTEQTSVKQPAQTEVAKDKKIKDKVIDSDDDFTKMIVKNPQLFNQEFAKFTEPQKYYFCASFAMYGLWRVKPITASAMVNYFMGLGVAKHNVGINDETFPAFRSGRNSCRHEALSDYIIKQKVCEVILNDAADFANKKNYKVGDLDKRGKIEAERVLQYIKKEKLVNKAD